MYTSAQAQCHDMNVLADTDNGCNQVRLVSRLLHQCQTPAGLLKGGPANLLACDSCMSQAFALVACRLPNACGLRMRSSKVMC